MSDLIHPIGEPCDICDLQCEYCRLEVPESRRGQPCEDCEVDIQRRALIEAYGKEPNYRETLALVKRAKLLEGLLREALAVLDAEAALQLREDGTEIHPSSPWGQATKKIREILGSG